MRNLLIAPLAILGGVGIAGAEPRFEEGMLSGPTRAKEYLAGRADLVPGGDLVVEREGPNRVRFRRHHRGVPIIGGVVTVRLDEAARVRWVASEGGEVPADLSVSPEISAANAVRTASGGTVEDVGAARLAVWAPPGRRARLAWDVDRLPGASVRELWRVIVDATDGRVLYRENRVRTAKKGLVFMSGNPVTGGLTEVDLPLPDGATRLENADILARNCIDTSQCPVQVGTSFFRRCAIEPKATADGNFDFLYARPEQDTAPEDEFAEVQMFYHSDRVLEKFRTLGFVNLDQKPMEVIVNYREPADANQRCSGMTSTAPLLPYQNAKFTPGSLYHGWPTAPSILFGQGPKRDYAYDGDVVYHEFTHAVQFGLYDISFLFFDQHGLDTSGGAMTEATADYFSSSITGDPKVGEYAAQDVDEDFIRDLSGSTTCPDSLSGEVHDDSEPFSSALWDVRIALPETDRETFDQAVYNAMDSFADFESFASARMKIVAETRLLLGDGAADMAAQKTAARGLDGCNGRIIDTTLGAKKPFVYLYGVGSSALPEVPAAYQFKVSLTKPAESLFLTVDLRGNETSSTGPLHVILKPGSEPILWDIDTLVHDGTRSVTWPVANNKTLTIPGPFPVGPMVIQLSNTATGAWLMVDVMVFTDKEGMPATPLYDAGPGTMAMGDGGGCCQVGGGPGVMGALLMVGMVLLALRRRR